MVLPCAVFIGVNILPSDSSFKPIQRSLDPLLMFFLPVTHCFNPGYVF